MEQLWMFGDDSTHSRRTSPPDDLAAELTNVVYRVALRHGVKGSWLDLELDLWRVLDEAVREREQKWRR